MSNPLLNRNYSEYAGTMSEPLTINGVLQKTAILFVILFASAVFVWMKGLEGHVDMVNTLTTAGAISGFILALIIIFAKAMVLTPLYAVAQGLFIGGISMIFERTFPGIVQTATLGTIMTVAGMLFLYSTKIIQCTDTLRKTVILSTFAICGIYLVQIIGSFFGLSIPGLFSNGTVGIVFNLLVIGVAAFNLVIDFDNIESASNNFLPKNFEWYFGFSLMVTILWIYVEILRLVAKLQSRD